MSVITGDILTNTRSVAATALGAGWQVLPFVHDVKMNNARVAKQGYNVRPMEGTPSEGVTRCYTMDQRFELILTDTIVRGKDDTGIETSLSTLYNKADEIFKSLVNTKISMPTTVLNVFAPTLLQPELLEKEKIVVLRMQYQVKFRSALT